MTVFPRDGGPPYPATYVRTGTTESVDPGHRSYYERHNLMGITGSMVVEREDGTLVDLCVCCWVGPPGGCDALILR